MCGHSSKYTMFGAQLNDWKTAEDLMLKLGMIEAINQSATADSELVH